MMTTMSRAAAAAFFGLALLSAGACSKTQQYAATGGVLGAGAGAIVAGATGGSVATGAVIGGAAGAVTGVVVARH
jgi:osmotically inducible lipoprotein OsmB